LKNEIKDKKIEEMLTDLDPPYESTEELKIGRLLDEYGVPFFYKQATIIYHEGKNEVWKPTFTLPQYVGMVIDYMAEHDEDEQDHILQRQKVYNYNQIPAVVLGPKDLTKPNWRELLYGKIEQAHHWPIEAANYRPGLL
jgi:hypothetical protein